MIIKASRGCTRVFATGVTTALFTALVSGCSSSAGAREASAVAPRIQANVNDACSAGAKDRRGRAAVTFTGATSGEATLRLEGEAYKSTVLVDVATGTVLELAEGTYQLRVTLSGYRAADKSFAVSCGKENSVAVPLSRR